jgi:hypothetical protein
MWQERSDYRFSPFHAAMAAPSVEELTEPACAWSKEKAYLPASLVSPPAFGFTVAPPSEITGARDLSHLPIYPTPKVSLSLFYSCSNFLCILTSIYTHTHSHTHIQGYFALPGVARAPRLTHINVTAQVFDVPQRAPTVVSI